jgi:hypothetical protein
MSSGTSGTSSSSGSTSGSSKIAPFLGSWGCTYSGTYQATGSSTVENNPAWTATAVVAAGTTTDLEISGIDLGTLVGSCDETLDVTGTDTATFSPTQQSCTFIDPADNDRQTNTRTGTLTVSGSTATIALTGTYTGTTPASVAYPGTFQGNWNCTAQ